jgi:hypothetical protein
MPTCPTCHQPAADSDTFCGACGAALKPPVATAPTPAPAVDTAPAQPVAVPVDPPREPRILGYATMAAALVSAACILPGAYALRYSGSSSVDSAGAVSDIGGVVSIMYLGGFFVGAILFMTLSYQLRVNLDRLNVSGLRYGPDQAIWPWFIPFFNYFRPVRFVCDLWRGLRGRAERPGREPYQTGTNVSAPGGIVAWWVLFIIVGPIGNAGLSSASAAGVFIASVSWSAVSLATAAVVYTLLKLNRQAVAAFDAGQPRG